MGEQNTAEVDASKLTPMPFQILSLDGGGLKGLFAAAVMAELEDDLQVSLVDHFDLITGTSTGGLIALALGAGLTPRAIVDFYLKHGPSIFRHGHIGLFRQVVRSKHGSNQLRSSLEEIFGSRLLGESSKRLVIPSYSLDADEVYVFKTPHHPRLVRDYKETFVDVGLATTAAPSFLPVFKLRNHRLIDGGVWANNPSLVGVAEAVSMLGASLSDIGVLSLGTTDPIGRRTNRLDRGGLVQWANSLPKVLLRAQALGAFHAVEHLIGPDHVTRLDVTVPDGLFKLDRLDAVAIQGLAEDVSRRSSPRVQPFAAHVAGVYTPCQPPEAASAS